MQRQFGYQVAFPVVNADFAATTACIMSPSISDGLEWTNFDLMPEVRGGSETQGFGVEDIEYSGACPQPTGIVWAQGSDSNTPAKCLVQLNVDSEAT